MALSGQLETEIEIQAPAAKFFNLFIKELHQLQNITGRVHEAKVLEGDWHSVGSVKHWTYTIDGMVKTCKENIESIDEENKTLIFNLFEGDVGEKYRSLKATLQVVEKDVGALAKWTYEYEKINGDIEAPNGYLDVVTELTKDVEAHLLRHDTNIY